MAINLLIEVLSNLTSNELAIHIYLGMGREKVICFKAE